MTAVTSNKEAHLLSMIIEGECWVFDPDPETKRQSSEWHSYMSLRKKRSPDTKSQLKVILLFFDNLNVLHRAFVSVGQTASSDLYFAVLKNTRNAFRRRRAGRHRNDHIVHHNAPCDTSLAVQEFLDKHQIPAIRQVTVFSIPRSVLRLVFTET